MTRQKNFLLIICIFLVMILLSGCIEVKTNKKDTSSIDGGVFKTLNKGTNWQQKVLIPTSKGTANFASVNIASMVMDPGDSNAIYFGSIGNGLLYTYDSGDSWHLAKGLEGKTIRDVAVDPNSKCIIYVAVGNRLYRSNDCNRSWTQVYQDDQKTTVDAIAIDHYNSLVLYIAVSRGDIIKSYDRGNSWQTINRTKDKIEKIIIDPNDSRNVYLRTAKKGIIYSSDNGQNWGSLESLSTALSENKLGSDIKDFVLVEDNPDVMFIATNYGMLKSTDRGTSWEKIELIPSEKNASIYSMTVNPQNIQEIYYVTNYIFYRSLDGGANWTPVKLPTSRVGWKLLINPDNPNIIYMGVKGAS